MISLLELELMQKIFPWKNLKMVEQDLILSRAVVCLFDNDIVRNALLFRGGTALNKLFLKPASRYSEDLDFVQKTAQPIGPTLDAMRSVLDPWLGEPKRKFTPMSSKLTYRYSTTNGYKAKLKVEINTIEHFQVLPTIEKEHSIDSKWFSGKTIVPVYQIEELIATKIKALYQRRKGRDLFDLWYVLKKGVIDLEKTMELFREYNKLCKANITQNLFLASQCVAQPILKHLAILRSVTSTVGSRTAYFASFQQNRYIFVPAPPGVCLKKYKSMYEFH